MASRTERRRRMTDLFTEGRVLQVGNGDVVFIKKLNQFEDGEARADATAARSRFTLTLRKPESPDTAALHEAAKRMGKERLIDGIVASRYTKYMAEASTSLQADPAWAERLMILDRTDFATVKEDERTTVDEINREYLDDLQKRVAEREANDREDLARDTDEAVQTAYEEAFIDSRAAAVYIGEYKLGQLAWAVRMCDATQEEDQTWNHDNCKHARLYVDEMVCGQGHVIVSKTEGCEDPACDDPAREVRRAIEFVREEPDTLLETYTRAFDNLHVPLSAAKGSASQQSSSALSRPPSEEEASTPSTPEVTQPEPVSTSA